MPDLPLLVFDVNETLLDLETMAHLFERMFGDRAAMREWFNQLVLYSQALSLSADYVPFGELGGAVLRMVAAVRGREVGERDLETVREAVAAMPPHPEVAGALARLRAAGFRLFTLTNNPRATCVQQLEGAGLLALFERQFSIDDGVRRYKPAPETYRAVEQALAMPPARLCLIACHPWDTLGAVAAGWQAALILRLGNAPLDVGGQPAIVGKDLDAVADALIDRYSASIHGTGRSDPAE